MIEKEILLQRIEPYMDRFEKYFKLRYIRLSESDNKELAELAKEINPRFNLNTKLNCSSCIRDAIIMLSNYYDREIKKVNTEEFNKALSESSIEVVKDKASTAEVNESLLTTEAVKDEAYYESLDKRSKEYKEWKASQTES